MADDGYPQPPEARLITERIDRMVPRPSRAALARQAGISSALWAKIEKGYDQHAGGVKTPYRGSARAVAAIAAVLNITPAELRKCGRDDAARNLKAAPVVTPEPAPSAMDELLREVRESRERVAGLEAKLDRLLSRRRNVEDPNEDNGTPARAG